jgi:hypothetical protein
MPVQEFGAVERFLCRTLYDLGPQDRLKLNSIEGQADGLFTGTLLLERLYELKARGFVEVHNAFTPAAEQEFCMSDKGKAAWSEYLEEVNMERAMDLQEGGRLKIKYPLFVPTNNDEIIVITIEGRELVPIFTSSMKLVNFICEPDSVGAIIPSDSMMMIADLDHFREEMSMQDIQGLILNPHKGGGAHYIPLVDKEVLH